MSKYTPGLWTANGDQVEVETEKNDGYRVCDVFGPDYKANANLIAAAPDLLEALKAIELARTTDETKDWLKASKLSDAAIAKAEGR